MSSIELTVKTFLNRGIFFVEFYGQTTFAAHTKLESAHVSII